MAVNRKRLVFFENWIDPVAESVIAGCDDIELVRLSYAAPEEENWAAFKTACGYQVHPRAELKSPWFPDAVLLARAPNLLACSSTGAGYDMIDVPACTQAGVIVCNQGGANLEAVAEHALGLMLACSKRIGEAGHAMRTQPGLDRFRLVGNDLLGKTVGVVGIGHIGTRTAELCRTLFRMTVLAYDPYLSADIIAARGATKVDLPELLRRSDFVTVHCPRTEETLGMFGAAEFSQMQPTAYFINTARGRIHDERDLAQALRDKRIAGTGIDVWDEEPPPIDHPLLQLPNVVATPHSAGITVEACRSMAVAAAEQWIALLRGEVPPRLVNPEAWPAYARRCADILGFAPAPLSS
jgi:D-3-phosphoglycerate dehydrogenase